MTASISSREDTGSSSIPRERTRQDTRSTSFHALPAFDHASFCWSTRENNLTLFLRPAAPLSPSKVSQKEKKKRTRSRQDHEKISRSRLMWRKKNDVD
ncbi:hypothetical protein X777_13314 [Ooceraea biroi]|uniref:Uncharacterized protein n=1 Tax=Ooceraea biroi TaxID=2015173 RepID=A0A026WWX6_OOCBI|nr:hypothetical protein X777_13314 [Ooceraea biroi]